MRFGRRWCWVKTVGGRVDLSLPRPGFDPRSVYLRLVVDKLALEFVYLRMHLVSPVSIIPTVPNTHIHIHIALTRRTNGRSSWPLETAMLFRKVENTGQKSTFTAIDVCFQDIALSTLCPMKNIDTHHVDYIFSIIREVVRCLYAYLGFNNTESWTLSYIFNLRQSWSQ
jgi:hypothetical protein